MTYDPEVHRYPWQNDRPFVLEIRHGHVKMCRGCDSLFEGVDRFVLRHREIREFWCKGRRMLGWTPSFYHFRRSCVHPLHPYFDRRKVTVTPKTEGKLTSDDIALLRDAGVDCVA